MSKFLKYIDHNISYNKDNVCAICDGKIQDNKSGEIFSTFDKSTNTTLYLPCCNNEHCAAKIRNVIRNGDQSGWLGGTCLNCDAKIVDLYCISNRSIDKDSFKVTYVTCSLKCCQDSTKALKSTIKTKSFKCKNCGISGTSHMRCGQCRIYRYCSKDCQKKHWKAGHKEECQLFTAKK